MQKKQTRLFKHACMKKIVKQDNTVSQRGLKPRTLSLGGPVPSPQGHCHTHTADLIFHSFVDIGNALTNLAYTYLHAILTTISIIARGRNTRAVKAVETALGGRFSGIRNMC